MLSWCKLHSGSRSALLWDALLLSDLSFAQHLMQQVYSISEDFAYALPVLVILTSRLLLLLQIV